ncbi:MAG TPA: hypothetical protein VIY52_09140 [Streptosporangiaceae bacterium]
MKLACIQASRSGSANRAMISSSGSGRSTRSVTWDSSRTGRPSYRLATPSAMICSATASHAAPMVSASSVRGSSSASRIVTPAAYAPSALG